MAMEALTTTSAKTIARQWIVARSNMSTDYRSQTRWMFDQLAELCIAEALSRGDDEDDLSQRISDSHDILYGAWWAAAPAVVTKWWRDNETPTEEEQKQIDAAKAALWRRHDPEVSFREGFESKDHIAFDKASLHATIAAYLARPWLRHPTMDWIFLDMTITGELCAYGESIKQGWVNNSETGFDMDMKYHRAKGNLKAINTVRGKQKFERLNMMFWFGVVLPIAVISAAFHFAFGETGRMLRSIFASLWAITLVGWIATFIRGRRKRAAPIPKPEPLQLWVEMYHVWRALKGPVVNPRMVREAMQKSTDKGAAWDNPSWAIIDRVISIDPAVWVVERGHS
jgi:hypothetical protein